jgi:hypothetical protein
MAIGKTTMEQWIRDALYDQDKVQADGTPAKCTGLVLCHVSGASSIEVHGVRFPAGTTWTPDEVDRLAKLFNGKADTDAQDANGIQTYDLLPFYEGSTKPQGRFRFRSQGRILSTDADGYGNEDPTPTGRAMQRMRIDDGFSTTLLVGNREMVNQLVAVTRLQGQQLAEAMHSNMEMFQGFYRMMMDKVIEERELRRSEIQAIQSAKEKEALFRMLPALINTMSGKQVLSESAEDTALIETIARGLKPEQLGMLKMLGLPPLVEAAVLARFERIMKKKDEEDKLMAKLTDPAKGEEGGSELAKAELQ